MSEIVTAKGNGAANGGGGGSGPSSLPKASPSNASKTLVNGSGGIVRTPSQRDSRLTALEEKKRRLEELRARRLKRNATASDNGSVDGSLGTLSYDGSTTNTSVNSSTPSARNQPQNFDRELAQYHKEHANAKQQQNQPTPNTTPKASIAALANHLEENSTPTSRGGGATFQQEQQQQQQHAHVSSSSSVASASASVASINVASPQPPIFEAEECPFHLKNTSGATKTSTTTQQTVILSESADRDIPRHTVGCTPHECHASIVAKDGFPPLDNTHRLRPSFLLQEAKQFLQQYVKETKAYTPQEFKKRFQDVETDIVAHGAYRHTTQELEFGCRVAWRNTGRCIGRRSSSNPEELLQVLDHREVRNADDCFDKLVQQLKKGANIDTPLGQNNKDKKNSMIRPTISVFQPKPNFEGVNSRVRIWNPSLISYAGYTLSTPDNNNNGEDGQDGTTTRRSTNIMGDAQNLEFTALCVHYGWTPPQEPSDFDVLPLLISDDSGHDKPKVYVLPVLDAMKLQIPLEHPTNEMFRLLGLSWHSISTTSHMGIDIGGIYYQTAPYTAYQTVTQISRALLDKQRYDMAERIAAVCDIPTGGKNQLWKDQVQLELHKAIHHSFTKHGVTIVDHHAASDEFLKFYNQEIQERKKCPADWKWLVPPAGGSMSSVYHQEMLNFILKPQYRHQIKMWEEQGIIMPAPIPVKKDKVEEFRSSSTSRSPEMTTRPSTITTATEISDDNVDDKNVTEDDDDDDDDDDVISFHPEACMYKRICIFYGSDTGTSLSYATRFSTELGGDVCVGPVPLDHLPRLLRKDGASGFEEPTLVLVFTSTLEDGKAPSMATNFLPEMAEIPSGSIGNCDFCVFALCNSAYIHGFATFGYDVHDALRAVGCHAIRKVHLADELKNQEEAFRSFRAALLNYDLGLLYEDALVGGAEDAWDDNQVSRHKIFGKFLNQTVDIKFQGVTHVIDALERTLEQTVNMKFQGGEHLSADGVFPTVLNSGQDLYKPWSIPSRNIERSMDLFTFCFDEEASQHLSDISPGDRMALYPANSDETVDLVMRMLNIDEMTDKEELRKHLTMGFDLARPIEMGGLQVLREMVTHDKANFILDSLLQDASIDATPSVEVLVNILPPGSIPSDWIGSGAPRNDPRWFSITSMSEEKRTLTICQETFHFPSPNNHAGLTSRWLRNLNADAQVSTLFVKSDFHLPKDESAPVILFGTGAAIASFYSFWSSHTYNPIYLFYGCKNEEELMFSAEIQNMKEEGRMESFLSFEKGLNRISMQDQISLQAEMLLPLLHNSNTHVYVCGPSGLESMVKSALCQLMAFGDSNISGLGMQRAMEWLVLKKHKKTYIPEVYGSGSLPELGPMAVLWQEATAKVARVLTALDKVGRPRPGKTQKLETSILQASNGNGEDTVRNSRIAVNPIIGTGGALEVGKSPSRRSLVETVSEEFDKFPTDQAARDRQEREDVSSMAVEAPTGENVVEDLLDMDFDEESEASKSAKENDKEEKNEASAEGEEQEELDRGDEGASEAAVVVRAPSNPQQSSGFVHGAGSGFSRVWS